MRENKMTKHLSILSLIMLMVSAFASSDETYDTASSVKICYEVYNRKIKSCPVGPRSYACMKRNMVALVSCNDRIEALPVCIPYVKEVQRCRMIPEKIKRKACLLRAAEKPQWDRCSIIDDDDKWD